MSEEENRRQADRHLAYIGAELETPEGRVRSSITRDASETGLLLLTRARLQVGQAVRVRVHLPNTDGSTSLVEVTGSVVRREALPLADNDLWHEKVAIVLDEPNPELARRVHEVAEAQERIYGGAKG